jgi:mxaJ protein
MSSGSNFSAALAALVVVVAGMAALYWHLQVREPHVTFIQVPVSPDLGQENAQAASGDAAHTLRVCADPNNMPFSNERGEGFENRLAEMIATDLHRTVSYTWWPQRRGFVRNTLREKNCDIVMGVPARFEMVQTTRPYYRSSYVFVTRQKDELSLTSLDDPRLRTLRIGLHAIGDDYSNVPPAQALATRGIVANVRGYSIYGDYSQPDPPRALIDALASGEIDIAIAWGPLGGYFAQRASIPLSINALPPSHDPLVPTTFAISMGVRRGENAFKDQIETVIARHRTEIDALLERYGVPLVAEPSDTLAHLEPRSQRHAN